MTNNPPKRHRKKRFRRAVRSLSQNPFTVAILSKLAIWYLTLVTKTTRFVVEPDNALEIVKNRVPIIVSVWHGQHILLPAIPVGLNASAMISRNFDGEITARVAEHFGNKTIRASGGRSQIQTLRKGGITGFLDMLKALDRGENVIQTADIPHGTARRAGLGIVMLAHKSGAPIIPLAVASSRRFVFKKAWDKAALNLPFGTTVIQIGDLIEVPEDAGDEELEQARNLLELEMHRITKSAYNLTGKPE